MGIEALVPFHLNDLGMAEAEQMERPADGAGVDRLPEPIQYKHGMFEYGIHHLSQPIVRKLAEHPVPATQKAMDVKHFRANACRDEWISIPRKSQPNASLSTSDFRLKRLPPPP